MSDTFDNPAARTAAEFQKLCDSVYSTIPAPPGTITALKTFTENYKRIISTPSAEVLSKTLQDFSSQITKALYGSSEAAQAHKKHFEDFQSALSELSSGFPLSEWENGELQNALGTLTKSFITPQTLTSFASDAENTPCLKTTAEDADYVIIPEDNIKDIVCPDVIALPLPGQHRLKIRTDIFIALLNLLIALIPIIISFFPTDQQPSVQNYYNIQIQTLEYHADYSNSSLKDISSDLQSVLEDIHPEDDSSE